MAALCNYGANGDAGCSQDPDAAGEYDIKMPEPHDPDIDTDESQYKIRVKSGQAVGCSEAFALMPSEKAPQPGDVDGPFLEVISPMENDGAVAGEDYTVEVRMCIRGDEGCFGGCERCSWWHRRQGRQARARTHFFLGEGGGGCCCRPRPLACLPCFI